MHPHQTCGGLDYSSPLKPRKTAGCFTVHGSSHTVDRVLARQTACTAGSRGDRAPMGGFHASATLACAGAFLCGVAAMYWPGEATAPHASCPLGFNSDCRAGPNDSMAADLPEGLPPVLLGTTTVTAPRMKIFTNASIWTASPEVRRPAIFSNSARRQQIRYVRACAFAHQATEAYKSKAGCSTRGPNLYSHLILLPPTTDTRNLGLLPCSRHGRTRWRSKMGA